MMATCPGCGRRPRPQEAGGAGVAARAAAGGKMCLLCAPRALVVRIQAARAEARLPWERRRLCLAPVVSAGPRAVRLWQR
eukprot:15436393-Alexandrium_andersonii.AAC.1